MFEIGATLREARERRQLTYEQVEAETKIRAKYLRALEEEEFDSLPSGTYVRGFLRAYASYLGLDGRLFVDEYASRFGTRHDDELFRRRRERPMTQRRESSSAVLVALIAVVAIGVLFFVAWRFGPGEAASPAPCVYTVTETEVNANPATNVSETTATENTAVRTPVRADVTSARRRQEGHDLGQDHPSLDGRRDRPAPRRGRRPPRRRCTQGRLWLRGRGRDPRERLPGTSTDSRSCSSARGHGSSGPRRRPRASQPGKIPPPAVTEQK